MSRTHLYRTEVEWTGNGGAGTSDYRGYARDHTIRMAGKPEIPGSSDPAFRGDAARHNPEELLLVSLSACHMLWYLHLCAEAGVVVTGYLDRAEAMMAEDAGGGQFTRAVLRPAVTLAAGADAEKAAALHGEAHRHCFIARSVNFPVEIEPGFA